MKIDTDLRAAIRSAERCQPSSDHQKKRDADRAAIADLLNRCPKKKSKIIALIQKEIDADAAAKKAREDLCKQFGLRHYSHGGENIRLEELEFSNCGKGGTAFVNAGGKLPPMGIRRWNFDEVMSELAAAEPKRLQPILKKYGINWK